MVSNGNPCWLSHRPLVTTKIVTTNGEVEVGAVALGAAVATGEMVKAGSRLVLPALVGEERSERMRGITLNASYESVLVAKRVPERIPERIPF